MKNLEVVTRNLGDSPSDQSVLIVADTTELAAIKTPFLSTDTIATLGDGSQYKFNAASTTGGIAGLGGGRWWLISPNGEAVNVKTFGAVGDGVTDDTDAIQSALDSGKSVFFPIGQYLITSALDLTNRSGGALKIVGESWGIGGNGSVILAKTGGVAIDCTGSQFLTFEDLAITASGAGRSTVGILFARSTTSQYAQFNRLKNVYINIATSPAAFGGLGGVGVYNLASEIHTYESLYAIADTPLVFSAQNSWNVASVYQTIEAGITSTSQLNVSGASTFQSLLATSHAVFLQNAIGVNIKNGYYTGIGVAALYMDGGNTVKFSGHIEGFDHIADLRNSTRLEIDVTGGNQNNAPIYLGSDFTSLIDLFFKGTISATWPRLIDGLFTSVCDRLIINLNGDDGTISLSNLANERGYSRMITTNGIRQKMTGCSVMDSLIFTAVASASVPNLSLFVNSADNKLSYKDNAGVVNALY